MSQTRWLAAVLTSASLAGCNQQAPPAKPPAGQPAISGTAPKTDSPPASKPGASDPAPTQPTSTAASKPAGPSQVKFDLRYATEDFVIAAVGHPQRIMASPLYAVLREEGLAKESDLQEAFGQFTEPLGVSVDQIEEIAVLVDRKALGSVAREMGLPTESDEADGGKKQFSTLDYRNHLKQLGLAFHNYHDIYQRFPKAGGPAEATAQVPDGLSWRVYLLPLVDQFELYNEFHLDEPWDSEHNKTLIEKMPDVYAVKGVEETGKTSIHVFTSEGAAFAGPDGAKIADMTDGTSNTILAAVAGPDTAEIWTKPGGLKVDPEKPLDCLGKIDPAGSMVLFGSGEVRTLPADLVPANFVANVTMAAGDEGGLSTGDREEPPMIGTSGVRPPFGMYGTRPEEGPVLAITVAAPLVAAEAAERILGMPEAKSHEGHDYYVAEGWAVAFPTEKTALVGGEAKLQKLLAATEPGTSPLAKQLQSAANAFDVLVTVDLASQAALRDAVIQQQPLLGALGNVDLVTLAGSLTGTPGDPALRLDGVTRDPNAAQAIAAMFNGFLLTQLKTAAVQASQESNDTDENKELREIMLPGIQALEMKVEGNSVSFQWPIPEGFDRVPELLKPEIRKLREVQQQTERRNNFKQLGLAFHNYHDTFTAMPPVGGAKLGENGDPDNPGLSWRVHLLPYIDQAPMYNEFKFDEPWDSDHNKALIERMPDIFKVKGIEEPGKTSVHVFVGKGAPFADFVAPKLRDFTDGVSNVLLVVEAGPDTAEIWTKPGGLDFDPADPLKALGEIGETFLVLLGDGSIRTLPKAIEPDTLRKLIQHADGEPVDVP